MLNYKDAANTLRRLQRAYGEEATVDELSHIGAAIALCEERHEQMQSPEQLHCAQVAALLAARPEDAAEIICRERAHAWEAGVSSVRDAHALAYDQYMSTISALQTRHDQLAVQLQDLRTSMIPGPSSFVRAKHSCSRHEYFDANCPGCIFEAGKSISPP